MWGWRTIHVQLSVQFSVVQDLGLLGARLGSGVPGAAPARGDYRGNTAREGQAAKLHLINPIAVIALVLIHCVIHWASLAHPAASRAVSFGFAPCHLLQGCCGAALTVPSQLHQEHFLSPGPDVTPPKARSRATVQAEPAWDIPKGRIVQFAFNPDHFM